MSSMRWLPDTLFGRLFAAIVAVIAATLLVMVILILHERREFAFAESGAGAAAASVIETSEYLAKLSTEQRAEAVRNFRSAPIFVDSAPRRRPLPAREDPETVSRSFARQIQKQLGANFRVSAGPPRHARSEVIVVRPEFGEPADRGEPPRSNDDSSPSPFAQGEGAERFGPRPGGRRGPWGRVLDVAVALPDGDQVVFRTPAPRAGPPIPRQLFIELAALTVALSVVLYAMTRSITRPLAELARGADAVGRGTQTQPLEERGAREVRAATRAFNAMQDRLRRYLDSRTRVLAAMSHDLRTPLTRLRLRVESIDDEELRQRCVVDLDEMTRMVQGALGVFRGLNDEEPVASFDVNLLLREVQQQYADIGKQVSLQGQATQPFTGKALALKRCLGNLLDNALQYGTHATLSVADGGSLIIRVRDDGPGIPEESLEQVFEPFFRLESSRNRATGGTGLGLSIARDVALSHGGSLTLRNHPEGGLEAELELPRGTNVRPT